MTFHTDVPATGHINPYARDPDTLARIWIKPGTPGLTHRIGGIEKGVKTGNINYEAANHQEMTDIRRDKIAGVARAIPLQGVDQGPIVGPARARRLGLDLRPDPQGASSARGRRGWTSPTSTSATSGRCRRISASC